MRYVLWLILSLTVFSASAQFTGTDSLRNYNNRYITTNPATAFTNNRLNTLIRGIIDFIDTARAGSGGSVNLGIDTVFAVNDSTIRYRKNGVFRQFSLKGVYDSRRKVDTIYKSNDTTLTFTVNGALRTVVIPGGTNLNLATADQTATGNRNHNWNDHWLLINNVKALDINTDHADPNHINNRYKFQLTTDSTVDGTPLSLMWGLRNIDDDIPDSVHFEMTSTSNSTTLHHTTLDSTKGVKVDLNAGATTPNLQVNVSNISKNSTFSFGQITQLKPSDSLQVKSIPAANADSVLGIRAFNGGVNTIVKFPASAITGTPLTLNNVGTGFAWATTPNGSVKKFNPTYGLTADSSTSNTISLKVDTTSTNHIVTTSQLKDTAGAIRAAVGSGEYYLNIIDYGAVADGVTDCTNAINATINAAASVKGKVYIPKGTFLVRSSYRDTAVAYRPKGIILQSDVTIFGAGRDLSIIKLSNPPAGGTFVIDNIETLEYTSNCAFWNIFTGNNVSNVVLNDFSINGNIANQINIGDNPYHTPQNGWADSSQTNGIQFINGTNNRVQNVKLDSTVGYGIWYDSSTNGNSNRVEVTTCYNGGIYYTPGSDGSSLTNSLITNNHCDNVRVKSSNILIQGNETSWAKFNPEESLANFTGIYVECLPESLTGIKIIGNYSHDNSAFGIDMWNAGDTVNSTYPGAAVLVMGNTIAYNCNGGIEVALPNVTIANNLIYNNGANSLGVVDYDFYRPYGINITYATNTTKGVNITGNTFRDSRGYQTYAVGNGPDLTIAAQLTFSNNTVSGGLGMFEPGSVSTSVPGSMLLGNTYRTGEAEQVAPSYINNPLTVVTSNPNDGITVKSNAAPAFWLNNNTSNISALGLATSAEVWTKQALNKDVVLWNAGNGIHLSTAPYGDSSEIVVRKRKMTIRDTLQIDPSGVSLLGNGLLVYNLDGVANASRSIFYPTSRSANAGININLIPRGTGVSSTDKASLHFFNSDVLADGTNYEFLQLKAGGTDGYIWNSVSAGSGTARDFRFQFNGTDKFTVKADGNVGISDVTPDSRLDIETNVNSPDGVIVTNINSGVSSQALYRVVNNTGELAQFGIFGSNHPALPNYTTLVGTKGLRLGSDQDVASGGTNTFDILTGGYSSSPAVQIKGNGNMLVGTTTDNGAKFQVNGDATVADEAYDATTWNGSLEVPTKNAIRDKIESMGGGSSYTFSNGLTESSGAVKLGGTLTQSTTIDGSSSYTTTFTGSKTFANSTLIAENTSSGRGISGITSTGVAVHGSSGSSGVGVLGLSSSGYGLWGQSTTGQGLYVQSPSTSGAANITANPSSTNTVHTSLTLARVSTSAGADGIGEAIDFNLNNTTAAGSVTTATRLISKLTTATSGAEVSQLEVWGVNGGTLAKKFSIAGTGQITEDGYGSGSFTVTPATTPVYSSTGVKGERVAPKIYTGLISATAGNDPTVTVLGTNEIGSIVWTRASAGVYNGTLSGAFTSNKTWITIQRGSGASGFVNGWIFNSSANVVQIQTLDNAGSTVDAFDNISFEIRVYP